MKKVLYLSNIEVPYRVRFFNLLAQHCDLTVLYERELSSNRDKSWAKSEKSAYKKKYLHGIKIGNEGSFSLGVLKEIFSGYDDIIVGCYNNPVQMLAIIAMRIFRKKYILNLDGEPFLDGTGAKASFKKFFLKGADKYLTAGEKSAESLKKVIFSKQIVPYYFSSFSEDELAANAKQKSIRGDTILVVGQYFDYKGMDVALKAAQADESHFYKFVGMGNRTELFKEETKADKTPNVELVPFLNKQKLCEEYKTCKMLVLPSRKECWGLVINEAASFGTPVVSTLGSGAAVEFIANEYPQYLAKPDDSNDLLAKIKALANSGDTTKYSQYLINKSKNYSIEKSVNACLDIL